MTDPIADMLTRIRNGLMAGRGSVVVPYSHLKESIIKILVEQGFVGSYEVSGAHFRSFGGELHLYYSTIEACAAASQWPHKIRELVESEWASRWKTIERLP